MRHGNTHSRQRLHHSVSDQVVGGDDRRRKLSLPQQLLHGAVSGKNTGLQIRQLQKLHEVRQVWQLECRQRLPVDHVLLRIRESDESDLAVAEAGEIGHRMPPA